MPMEYEKFEGYVNELLDPELDHARKTEILTDIKTSHSNDIKVDSEKDQKIADLDKKRLDLLDANSKLFRQIPTSHEQTDLEKQKQVQSERSKTLTISDLEK